jgi:nickel/cobalt exporter
MAALALHFRDRIDVAHAEPWLQAVSGLFVLGMAFWMGARVRRGHCGHSHGHGHDHSHGHGHHHHDHEEDGDAHDRAHAQQVARALKHDGTVTDGQVILFGLTGGLTPCPSALAVLLLCLQAKRAALGMGLVLAFSLGLALTLVLVGVAAAWGAGKASTRWPKLSAWAERAPWLSVAVLTVLGVVLLAQGLRHLL